MADATLETRGAKDIGNATRNSFTSFERTSASRRELSSVSRLAWDVMVYDKCVSHFKTVSHALKTPYQDVMSRHSYTLPRHPIKTSCQDTQTRFQDTLSRYPRAGTSYNFNRASSLLPPSGCDLLPCVLPHCILKSMPAVLLVPLWCFWIIVCCLAQVKSTDDVPDYDSSCCLHVKNDAKSKTPTALRTVKHVGTTRLTSRFWISGSVVPVASRK